MDKKSPLFTASAASVIYFIIYLMLRYLLQPETVNIIRALKGAAVFWAVIFLVHHFLKRRYSD